jgi:hypothetical protein
MPDLDAKRLPSRSGVRGEFHISTRSFAVVGNSLCAQAAVCNSAVVRQAGRSAPARASILRRALFFRIESTFQLQAEAP